MTKQEERSASHALYDLIFRDGETPLILDLYYICVGPYSYTHDEIRMCFQTVERLLKRYHKQELSLLDSYIDTLCDSSLKEIRSRSRSCDTAAVELLDTLLHWARDKFRLDPRRNAALKWLEMHYIDGIGIDDMLLNYQSHFKYYSDGGKRTLYREIKRGKRYLSAVTCWLMFSAFWAKLSEKERLQIMWCSVDCDPKLNLL